MKGLSKFMFLALCFGLFAAVLSSLPIHLVAATADPPAVNVDQNVNPSIAPAGTCYFSGYHFTFRHSDRPLERTDAGLDNNQQPALPGPDVLPNAPPEEIGRHAKERMS